MIQVYHNPRCGKSRNCLSLLEKEAVPFETILYLTETPTFDSLKSLLEKLNMEAAALVRTKEKIWIENYKGNAMTEQEIIQAMVDYPILIERPIVIKDREAIIGRDLDQVKLFL